jgi:hypothetical protein
MKPLALIYGHDGFDPDINLNLRHFYGDLGFRVRTSRQLIDCQLLVITRTPNSDLDLSAYSQVHVYDYVCMNNDEFMKSIQHHPGVRVFSPSQARMNTTLQVSPNLEGKILEMLPPVSTSIWTNKPKFESKFKVVHIGNFKSSLEDVSDKFSSDFLKSLNENSVDVWGERWTGHVPRERIHGRASLLSVPSIYRSATLAIGIMYPYQRNLTISGRLWMAPLNGTRLLSEPNSQIREIPGVVESDFSAESIRNGLEIGYQSRIELAIEARKFWDTHYAHAGSLISNFPDFKNFSQRVKRPVRWRKSSRELEIASKNGARLIKYLLRLD